MTTEPKERKKKIKDQIKNVFWSVEKPDGSIVMGGNLDLDDRPPEQTASQYAYNAGCKDTIGVIKEWANMRGKPFTDFEENSKRDQKRGWNLAIKELKDKLDSI